MPSKNPQRLVIAVVAAVAIGLAVAAIGFSPNASHGQAGPSATPTATTNAPAAAPNASPAATSASGAAASASAAAPAVSPSAPARVAAAPAIDSDTAVRALLPPQFANADPLPGKWARADMPNAPGGYVVFIATVYPMADDQGSVAWWLLTNYLQWDGSEWLRGLDNYVGAKLVGDEVWLAQNLIDISALASPDPSWPVFTVGYTADGIVSMTLARTETLVEIYDLTLTTMWSRIDHLQEIDTSHAGYVKTHTEDVDWDFQDVDGDGIAELVATVIDAETVTLTGDAAPSLPSPGTTTNTTTEIYKWVDDVFVLTRQPSAPAAAPAATATATATPPAAATSAPSTPVPTPSATPSPTQSASTSSTPVATPSPTPTATPRASGSPAG